MHPRQKDGSTKWRACAADCYFVDLSECVEQTEKCNRTEMQRRNKQNMRFGRWQKVYEIFELALSSNGRFRCSLED